MNNSKLLDDREARYYTKRNLANKYKTPVISFNLNVPGFPKSDVLKRRVFFSVLSELKTFLLSCRIIINKNTENIIDNSAGVMYLAGVDYPENVVTIKSLIQTFEDSHSIGRFIDVDLMDIQGNPISSNKDKTCFYCGEYPAIDCMRKNRHSYNDLRSFQQLKMNKFLEKKYRRNIANELSQLITYSLLSEVSLTPKPGLVSTIDSGGHADMSFQTFINSISALTPFFTNLINELLFNNVDLSINYVREKGLMAEKVMNRATNNINTHKGVIFLFILIVIEICDVINNKEKFTLTLLQNKLTRFKNDIQNDVLINFDKTHGNKMKMKFPHLKMGIREQFCDGLPVVFNYGIIPYQKYYFSKYCTDKQKDSIMKLSLMLIMSVNNDSNVIYRGGVEKLDQVKNMSHTAYKNAESGDFSKYTNLCLWTKNEKLSAGGSADLLSLSLFIYMCSINPIINNYEF